MNWQRGSYRGRCCHWGGAISRGTAQMGDDESCVGDRVYCEGRCVLMGDRGAQSLGRLSDRKREGCVLLNVPEIGPWHLRAIVG